MKMNLDSLITSLRAAADPTRVRILLLLWKAELTVSELVEILGQSQPRISQHLKILGDAGFLERFKEGSWVFYRASDSGIALDLSETIKGFATDTSEPQRGDLERLANVRINRAADAAAFFKANAKKWAQIRALHAPERNVEEAILQHLTNRPIESLLDAGTGTGRMIELLAPFAKRAVGVDISPDMLAIARDRLMRPEFAHCQVRLGDVYRLSSNSPPMAGFDTVVFHQVLHYLEDPRAAVLAAARLLGPDGRMLIADFAPHNLEFLRLKYAHRRLGFSDEEVAGWFSITNLSLSACQTIKPESDLNAQLTVRIWLASRPLC